MVIGELGLGTAITSGFPESILAVLYEDTEDMPFFSSDAMMRQEGP